VAVDSLTVALHATVAREGLNATVKEWAGFATVLGLSGDVVDLRKGALGAADVAARIFNPVTLAANGAAGGVFGGGHGRLVGGLRGGLRSRGNVLGGGGRIGGGESGGVEVLPAVMVNGGRLRSGVGGGGARVVCTLVLVVGAGARNTVAGRRSRSDVATTAVRSLGGILEVSGTHVLGDTDVTSLADSFKVAAGASAEAVGSSACIGGGSVALRKAGLPCGFAGGRVEVVEVLVVKVLLLEEVNVDVLGPVDGFLGNSNSGRARTAVLAAFARTGIAADLRRGARGDGCLGVLGEGGDVRGFVPILVDRRVAADAAAIAGTVHLAFVLGAPLFELPEVISADGVTAGRVLRVAA